MRQTAERLNIKISNNVMDCGFVKIPSDRFREICDTCSAVLLFSCSEGMSTSLLTSMKMGLVPITCKGNGMEICGKHVIFSDGFHLEQIEKIMTQFIDMPQDEYKKMSEEIYEYANEVFSLEKFDTNFRRAMTNLL